VRKPSHPTRTKARARARAQDTANGVISVTERYAKPEFGSGISNEEDEDLNENQALEHDQDDEDDELLDPYTEGEEKEDEQKKRILYYPTHTSRTRSPDSVNSTASSHTARTRSAP
jgi:hypothetical protein